MNEALQEISERVLVYIVVAIIMIPFVVVGMLLHKRREKLYAEMAERHGLVYKKDQQIALMKSLNSRLFKYGRTVKVEGALEGQYKDHIFCIFTKTFYVKRSMKKFTVGSCEFGKTHFPHILLKSKNMSLYQNAHDKDRKVPIEQEYLKDFDLYAPEKYEIEILQIFTQLLLDSIQTISDQFSIELGGNRLYVYIDKNIQNKKYEKDMDKIISILKEIIDKTDGLLFRLKDDFEVLDEYSKK